MGSRVVLSYLTPTLCPIDGMKNLASFTNRTRSLLIYLDVWNVLVLYSVVNCTTVCWLQNIRSYSHYYLNWLITCFWCVSFANSTYSLFFSFSINFQANISSFFSLRNIIYGAEGQHKFILKFRSTFWRKQDSYAVRWSCHPKYFVANVRVTHLTRSSWCVMIWLIF